MDDAAEDTIAGMAPTGRRIPGPALDLVEVQAQNGLKQLALVHHEPFVDHRAIGADLQPRLSFMERPDVGGLARLAAYEPETATFVYATGTVWTVAEVVRTFAQQGEAAGVKAGLELCYLVAEILIEAAEAGAQQECPHHGNLNPWNIVLKADGQAQVLAWGIPQVEIDVWRDDERRKPREDSFRYVPPERLEGSDEDLSSDLFALGLVSLELMMGRPVYDGLVDDIRQQAARGEGMRRLYQWREKLPQNVREVLGRALKPDPDTRYGDPLEFVYALHDLLGSIDVDGPNLLEIMARVRADEKRGKAVMGGRTAMLTPREMAELAADLGDFEDRELPPPRRPRPTGRRPVVETGAPTDEEELSPMPADRPRWARATRRSEGPMTQANEAPPAEAGARERLRRRLRGTSQVAAAPPPAPPPPSEEKPARERLRRRSEARSLPEEPQESTADRVRRRLPRSGAAAEGPPRSIDPSTFELDLEGPDDVELEPVTGAHKAPGPRSPAPSEPEEDVDGIEVLAPEPEPEPEPEPDPEPDPDPGSTRSAAAALLARLRTSGSSRRRRRDPDPTPSPEPPPPPPAPPPVLASKAVRPENDEAPLPPVGRSIEVRFAGRAAHVPIQEGDRAAGVALRAALLLGGIPTDPDGRLVGTYQLECDGEVVPSEQPVAALKGRSFALRLVRSETRLVTLEVRTTPPTRLRTPVNLAVPAGWLVAGLVDWLLLPAGQWAVVARDEPVRGDLPLRDVLGDAAEIVVDRIRD